MSNIKGIILAGGTGSRLYPLTRVTNKHLLPIHNKPMICYALEALVNAGVSDIMLVTGGTHAGEFFRLFGNGSDYGVNQLFYSYQERAGGIAEALGLVAKFVADDYCAVILADNVFENSLEPYFEKFRNQGEGARILLHEEKDLEHLRGLGVAQFRSNSSELSVIREKPVTPPSSFAVTGLYFYDPTVFDIVSRLKPSARGELEITDVNNHYIFDGKMQYDIVEGFWGDAGESIEYYYKVNDFVRIQSVNKKRESIEVKDEKSPSYR